MIPKKIHYVWVGGAPLTELAKKCIESWKKFCPDYEIVRWDETNFDVTENEFCREAYENKKWAFVSDYMRLKVLSEYGGVYMDTDVEVIKPIDAFLTNKAFSGFENDELIPTGIMASEKGFDIFRFLLSYYEDRHFIKPDGTFDNVTNVSIITSMMEDRGFVKNGQKQSIDGFVFYPKDYFCPKEFYTDKIVKTKNTVCIHHFSASWHDKQEKQHLKNKHREFKIYQIKHIPNRMLIKLLGDDKYAKVKRLFGRG